MSTLAILCIDDEEMILDSLAMELEPQFPDLELTLLDQQAEAEEVVEELQAAGVEIAVIVCDYIMPGRRGDQVLAALHQKIPNARTVMLTGQSSLEGVTNAINHANLFRYIAKPWSKEDLRLTLQSALDSFQQDRAIQAANQELKELNDNLEVKVQERTHALTEANRKIQEYLDIIDDNVLISTIDSEGHILSVSKAFCRKYGFEHEQLIGEHYWKTLYCNLDTAAVEQILEQLKRGESWEGELEHVAEDGTHYWTHEIISPNSSRQSVILGFTSIFQDITDRKTVEKMSITDAMTGLYNRRHFDAMLLQRVKHARHGDDYLGLCMVDIDYFKRYNDNSGHSAGDQVLRQVGAALAGAFNRGSDMAFRIGGEEFALLMNVKDQTDAELNAEHLRQTIERLAIEHQFGSDTRTLSVSIGLVFTPSGPGVEPKALFECADKMLYRSKQAGRNRATVGPCPTDP